MESSLSSVSLWLNSSIKWQYMWHPFSAVSVGASVRRVTACSCQWVQLSGELQCATVRRAAACSCQWVQLSGELQRAAVSDSGSLSRWACVCCSQQTAELSSTNISAIRHDRPSKGSWKKQIPAQYSYWSQPRWLPPNSDDMQWGVKNKRLYTPSVPTCVHSASKSFRFLLLFC